MTMRFKATVGLCTAICALAGAIAWHRCDRSLLDRARSVADCKDWHQYVWLSDHEFLLIREGDNHRYKVIDADILSGRKTTLPRLAAKLSEFNNEGIIASPDGKWLLCL